MTDEGVPVPLKEAPFLGDPEARGWSDEKRALYQLLWAHNKSVGDQGELNLVRIKVHFPEIVGNVVQAARFSSAEVAQQRFEALRTFVDELENADLKNFRFEGREMGMRDFVEEKIENFERRRKS